MKMLVKCETKSYRVKGLSFHPKLSWILASLHNGVIQLWDYRIGSLIEKFEEHEGPVRGVDFHVSQPLFVSGGDDYRLKVWNYRQRKCIFTLLGHLDYIRTVQFHPQYPWILSASDDQTIRIWNWQSRNCIAVLTGHNHYVMCAQFHPKQDLLASTSLDQTIRIWDISGLCEKTVSIAGGVIGGGGNSGSSRCVGSTQHPHIDMFGTSDAVCKYILEGHDRGVNWVSFHPTLPLIVTGADDKLIKLWRYNDMKAWEVDTLRGHFNNVSCVLCDPHKDLLISNSEDRSIRLWDLSRRTSLHTFRRENDRFWILAAHSNSNLIAAGHDSGMVVFKLNRERPPMHFHNNLLFYVEDKLVQLHNSSDKSLIKLNEIRYMQSPLNNSLRSIIYNYFNPAEINLILFYIDGDNSSFDLITCTNPQDGVINTSSISTKSGGNCASVTFIARNRIAMLERSGSSLGVYSLNLELTRKIDLPFSVESLYCATNNRVILKSEEKVILFDLTGRKVVNELSCPGGLRYCVWSSDYQFVALISKHHLTLANQKFQYLYSFHENIRIKSGAWAEHGVFVYSTLSHVKYCLQNGDQGIIHSLIAPIYIWKVQKQKLYYIDRKLTARCDPLNCQEYLLKLALQKKQFDLVAAFVKNGRLCGNAVIGYLKKNGYPKVAMQFVENPKTRFNLALEYGNIYEAMKSAQVLDDKAIWQRLGVEALKQGNYQIVELVYQKIKNFEQLSFLYLITGNFTKLRKMLKIAELRKDVMSRFHNALMLGDVEERVRILAEVGQISLAFLTAKTHNLEEQAEALKASLNENVSYKNVLPVKPKLLVPPIIINGALELESANWPILPTSTDKDFDVNVPPKKVLSMSDLLEGEKKDNNDVSNGFETGEEDGWGDDSLQINYKENEKADDLGDTNLNPKLWDADQIDISVSDLGDTVDADSDIKMEGPEDSWLTGQTMVADLVAAGEFYGALRILKKRIGLINSEPLKKKFKHIYEATWASIPGIAESPSFSIPVLAKSNKLNSKSHKPNRLYDIKFVAETIKSAYMDVADGKFLDALNSFRDLLQTITLICCATEQEEIQLLEYISTCREYITALRLECERGKLSENDVARNLELVSYFTCCKMLSLHLFLVLRRAMSVSYKAENYITAASFARRLIQGKFGHIRGAAEEIAIAKKVLLFSENKATDAYYINFDPNEYEKLKLCCASLTRMDPGQLTVNCPFCDTVVKKEFSNTLCPTCELAELGARVLGLQFRPII